METSEPESRYQRILHGIAARRLTGLNRGGRAAVRLLIGLSVLAVVVSALMVFDKSAVDIDSEPTWHGVNGVMIVGGLVAATSMLAAALRPSEGPGASGRVLTVITVTLPYIGLAALGFTVLMLDPASLGAASRVVGIAVWICLVVGCMWVCQRAPALPTQLLETGRAVKILVPAVLLLLLAALAASVGRSTWAVDFVLAPTLALVGFSAVAALPALSTTGAAKSLESLHNRGSRLAEKVQAKPWMLLSVGLVKLAILAGLWLGYRSQEQPASKVGTSWSAWLAGIVLTLLVMTLFSVNRRLTFSVSDHLTVSRTTGLLVGAVLSAVVVAALFIGVRPTVRDQPLTVIAIAIVILAAVFASRMESRRRRIGVAAATLAFAVLCSLGLLPRRIGAPAPQSTVVRSFQEVVSQSTSVTQPINVQTVVYIIVPVLAVSVVALIVATFMTGRKSWGVYLTAVLIWLLSRHLLVSVLAPDMTELNIDLILTAVLTVVAALWVAGRRGPIDPFEIAATMTVTFFLIELPLFAGLMPNPELVKLWLAVLALITAAMGAIWSILADLAKPAEQREGFIRLCTSTLLLYLLLALAWALNDGATVLVQGISGLVLSYLAIPGSAARVGDI